MDVGVAVADNGARVFLNSLTLGVSTLLAAAVDEPLKRRWGWWAWPLMLRVVFRRTPVFRVLVTTPGGQVSFRTRQLVVGNNPHLAGPIRAAAPCSAQDGALDVWALGDGTLYQTARALCALMTGTIADSPAVRFVQCTECRLETTPRMAVDIDGEIWRATPLTVRALKDALTVIAGTGDDVS